MYTYKSHSMENSNKHKMFTVFAKMFICLFVCLWSEIGRWWTCIEMWDKRSLNNKKTKRTSAKNRHTHTHRKSWRHNLFSRCAQLSPNATTNQEAIDKVNCIHYMMVVVMAMTVVKFSCSHQTVFTTIFTHIFCLTIH